MSDAPHFVFVKLAVRTFQNLRQRRLGLLRSGFGVLPALPQNEMLLVTGVPLPLCPFRTGDCISKHPVQRLLYRRGRFQGSGESDGAVDDVLRLSVIRTTPTKPRQRPFAQRLYGWLLGGHAEVVSQLRVSAISATSVALAMRVTRLPAQGPQTSTRIEGVLEATEQHPPSLDTQPMVLCAKTAILGFELADKEPYASALVLPDFVPVMMGRRIRGFTHATRASTARTAMTLFMGLPFHSGCTFPQTLHFVPAGVFIPQRPRGAEVGRCSMSSVFPVITFAASARPWGVTNPALERSTSSPDPKMRQMASRCIERWDP
jgi:hypothetical protein